MSEPIVKVIKANPFNMSNASLVFGDELKVAAYARVSTESDQQEDSFERQVEYYTKYIQSNPKWRFIKVYSDPGISGTRADKRPGFQEMIKDCHEGKINRILVKSIARFARNTVDALQYIRELKEIGVSIYFEAQNIDTGTPGGDILLTILAATAEEESRTISKNIKWSYQKKFEKGDFTVDYTRFLGYTRDDNNNFVIVPEEAEVVRRIYREFLCGYSIPDICKGLEKDCVKSPCKMDKWYYNTVRSILTNEKYYGAALMGKTFKPDVLSKKRLKNDGQVEQYFVENAFEGIISKQQFDMVQLEMKKRLTTMNRYNNKTYGQYSSKRVFSKKIRCGCCGGFYTATTNMRGPNGTRIRCWWCSNAREGKEDCFQKGISEDSIKRAFVNVLNDLILNYKDIESVLKMSISSVLSKAPTEKVEIINGKIDGLQDEMMALHKKRTSGEINSIEYANRGEKLAQKIDALKEEKQKLEDSYTNANMVNERINNILDVLSKLNPTTEFNDDIFRSLVDEIVVNQRTKLTFKFKVGIERTIETTIK